MRLLAPPTWERAESKKTWRGGGVSDDGCETTAMGCARLVNRKNGGIEGVGFHQ